jgi:2-dehydro-3-deoxyglucarate aldolase/4-hydroxy-2-oxoheptanedioate aldolase
MSFKEKLIGKDLLFGTIITLPSAEIVEIFCQAGFDWLFIDLEHGAMSIKDAQLLLQVAGTKIPCLVRVPSNDETWIKKVLDIGASGIIVPQVRTEKDVMRVVQVSKYPPEGVRSVGIARAQGYGENFQDYVASANREISVVIQIEHIDAVENIEKILKVPGIDCWFVGPYDLSASMGKTGLTTDPEVRNAISKVAKAAERASISTGIFGATTAAVEPYIKNGFTLIAVGIDSMLIGKAAKEIAGSCKAAHG